MYPPQSVERETGFFFSFDLLIMAWGHGSADWAARRPYGTHCASSPRKGHGAAAETAETPFPVPCNSVAIRGSLCVLGGLSEAGGES